jgi:hypothetical protein
VLEPGSWDPVGRINPSGVLVDTARIAHTRMAGVRGWRYDNPKASKMSGMAKQLLAVRVRGWQEELTATEYLGSA